MKRVTAILFILLANISLLGHAVLPHHHHDKLAVALTNVIDFDHYHHHSDHKTSYHYHHSHNHHNNHQHNHQKEDCLINESLFISYRSQELDFSNIENDNNIINNIYCSVCEETIHVQLTDIWIRFYSYQASIPPSITIYSNGLRAPPYC